MMMMVRARRSVRMARGRGSMFGSQGPSPAVAVVPDAFRMRLGFLGASVRAGDGVARFVRRDFGGVAVAEAGHETWFGGGG